MVTSPASGFTSPAISDMSVVLPAPLYPTIARNSPSRTDRLTPRSTCAAPRPVPYDLLTLLSSRKAIGTSPVGELLGGMGKLPVCPCLLLAREHGQTGSLPMPPC